MAYFQSVYETTANLPHLDHEKARKMILASRRNEKLQHTLRSELPREILPSSIDAVIDQKSNILHKKGLSFTDVKN